jgi:hypothetical protein
MIRTEEILDELRDKINIKLNNTFYTSYFPDHQVPKERAIGYRNVLKMIDEIEEDLPQRYASDDDD